MVELRKIIKKRIARFKNKGSNAVDFMFSDKDTIDPRERRDLNKKLNKKGLDGNGRFIKVDHGLQAIHEILSDFSLEIDEVLSSDLFRHDSGSRTFNLARKSRDPQDPKPIKNSMISFSWELLGNESEDRSKRRYEILAYIT